MRITLNTGSLVSCGAVATALLFAITILPHQLLSQSTGAQLGISTYTPTSTPAIPDLSMISSPSYIVTKNDGSIVLSKNIDAQYPIASLTKLMTGVVTLERAKLGKIMTVSERAAKALGDSGDLKAGDRVSIETLLFPLFMKSSNDAAEVISESLGLKNSRAVFVSHMNRKARTLRLSQTKFADPSGLSIKNVSTVRDIDILLRYVEKKYPILLTITTVKEYTDGKYDWKNTSSLSMMQGYRGGKTGFTTPAQQTASGIFLTKTSRDTVEPLHYTLLYSSNRNIDIELLRRYIEYHAELK